MFLRSAFNYDVDEASRSSALVCPEEEDRTQQQFADEVNINTIVRRFGLTGEVPNGIAMPMSADFTAATDFHTAMNLVRQAQESFMELPAATRDRFGNDPGAVLAFLENADNREEAIKLGMIAAPVEVPRDAVQAIDELAAQLKSASGA